MDVRAVGSGRPAFSLGPPQFLAGIEEMSSNFKRVWINTCSPRFSYLLTALHLNNKGLPCLEKNVLFQWHEITKISWQVFLTKSSIWILECLLGISFLWSTVLKIRIADDFAYDHLRIRENVLRFVVQRQVVFHIWTEWNHGSFYFWPFFMYFSGFAIHTK